MPGRRDLVVLYYTGRRCAWSTLENDRFEIYDRCPMSDVAMAISTDADTDTDVAYLNHLDCDVITADRDGMAISCYDVTGAYIPFTFTAKES